MDQNKISVPQGSVQAHCYF